MVKLNNIRREKKDRRWGAPLLILCFLLIVVSLSWFLYRSWNQPSYQQKQQFYQHNVEKLLTKMLGKSNYVANVSLQYVEISKDLESITYAPKALQESVEKLSSQTKNEDLKQSTSEEEVKNMTSSGKDVLDVHSLRYHEQELSPEAVVEEEDVENDLGLRKLPGLIPQKKSGFTQELPGFPSIKGYGLANKIESVKPIEVQEENPEKPTLQGIDEKHTVPRRDINERSINAAQDTKFERTHQATQEFNTGFEKKDSKTIVRHILNESKEKVHIPGSKLDRLSVSLVLNEDRLKLLNISKTQVAKMVEAVVGFNSERGDHIFVIAYPFKGIAYTLRKLTTHLASFFYRFRLFFYISMGIPFIVAFFYLMIKMTGKFRKDRQQKKEKRALQEKLQQAQETQTKIERQREEIMDLAKNKPEDFAKALLDWIEKVESI